MNVWRFHCGWLLAVGVSAVAHAQPELEVRAAFNRLIEAGNYAWEESYSQVTTPLTRSSFRPSTRGSGATVTDDYTTATIERRSVVLRGTQVVVKLDGGWRVAADLTEDEVAEILRRPMTLVDGAVEQAPRVVAGTQSDAVRHRRFVRTEPHEALRRLLQMAKNFRHDGAAIAADVASTFEAWIELQRYVATGMLQNLPPAQSALEKLTHPGSRPSAGGTAGRPMPPAEGAKLVVTLNAGAIEEFAVEFATTQATMVFTTKLLDIGTTKVEVDPEAKALFLDVAGSR